MPIETTLILLLNHVGTLKKIRSFVKDDMADFLHELGDIHYKTAIQCFSDAKKSSQPEREINMGITCLRQAHNEFYNNAFGKGDSTTIVEGLAISLTMGIYKPGRLKSGLSCIETSLALALSYIAVNDKLLALQFAEHSQECTKKYTSLYNSYDYSAASSSRNRYEKRSPVPVEDPKVKDFVPLYKKIISIINSMK